MSPFRLKNALVRSWRSLPQQFTIRVNPYLPPSSPPCFLDECLTLFFSGPSLFPPTCRASLFWIATRVVYLPVSFCPAPRAPPPPGIISYNSFFCRMSSVELLFFFPPVTQSFFSGHQQRLLRYFQRNTAPPERPPSRLCDMPFSWM